MATTDELLREVAAREAIRDLSARYCDCIWRNDLDGLVSLFTDGGTFIVEGLEVEAISRGHARLKKMYEKAIGEIDPRLFIHSAIVDLQGGTRATGRCYVEVFSAKLEMRRIGLGYYEDEYAKVGDKWKFASRRYFLDVIDTAVSLRKTFMV
ncbi:MAG: nuclear transport factor 2 family protein [Candidatus Binataceae bacterium]